MEDASAGTYFAEDAKRLPKTTPTLNIFSTRQESPDDFVVATGETHSVREFCELAFSCVGWKLKWEGSGVEESVSYFHELPHRLSLTHPFTPVQEVGRCAEDGAIRVRVSSVYYRPTEVDLLIGNPAKAVRLLQWDPKKTQFEVRPVLYSRSVIALNFA